MSKDGTRLGSLKQVVELRDRIAQLERENAELREALAMCERVMDEVRTMLCDKADEPSSHAAELAEAQRRARAILK